MAVPIIVALVGLAGVMIGAVGTYFATRRTNATNLQIARDRLNEENRLSIETRKTIHNLLSIDAWPLRSFSAIHERFSGLGADEMRSHLRAAGAISFRGTDGGEQWGLLERNKEKLPPKEGAALAAFHHSAASVMLRPDGGPDTVAAAAPAPREP